MKNIVVGKIEQFMQYIMMLYAKCDMGLFHTDLLLGISIHQEVQEDSI